jgi:hypothetical protein
MKPCPTGVPFLAILAHWTGGTRLMTRPDTYVQRAVDAIVAELHDDDQDPALLRLYALLLLTRGTRVTSRDVHDAWALWRLATRPDHPGIVPFDQLSIEVKRLDVPFRDAIRRAADRLASQP